MRSTVILILIAGLLFFSGCKSKTSPDNPEINKIKENLPVEFTGSFKWYDDTVVQEVSMSFSKVFTDDKGLVISLGKGIYNTKSGRTDIQVKMVIKPSTYQVEIRELNPDGNPDFVTDGAHIGHISQDLKKIEAVWTTEKTGAQGILALEADYFSR